MEWEARAFALSQVRSFIRVSVQEASKTAIQKLDVEAAELNAQD